MIEVGGVTHRDLTDRGCFHPQRRHLQLPGKHEHFPYLGVWAVREVISDWLEGDPPPPPTPQDPTTRMLDPVLLIC